MAYQVLARKYRPQRFADVAGQEHVTRTLKNALEQKRIAHGYIFSGHRGIGKTTIARILAMALDCRAEVGSAERPDMEPCLKCVSCREISSGSGNADAMATQSFDFIEIDAASNRGIDDVRSICSQATVRPARDKYKIFLLDEAHQITDAAFNAILKTLEEPPEWAVFMMATTEPENIPQTIRSRCQHFSFHAVRFDEILGQLRSIAEQEAIVCEEEALALLAEAGDGSMRDALSIMDQAIASAPRRDGQPVLEAALVRELMGTLPNAVLERLFETIGKGDSATLMIELDRLLTSGNSPVAIARQMVRYLRNSLMASLGGENTTLLQIAAEERARAVRTAQLFSEEELTRHLQLLLRTFDDLGFRQEQRFHLELGLLKLIHAQRILPMEQVLSGIATQSGGAAANVGPNRASAANAGHGAPRASSDAVGAVASTAKPASGSSTSGAAFSPTASTARSSSPFAAAPQANANAAAPRAVSSATQVTGSQTEGALARAVGPQLVPRVIAEAAPEQEPLKTTQTTVEIEEAAAAPVAADAASDAGLETARELVVKALSGSGHNSAAALMETAAWIADGNSLRIEVPMKAAMIRMTFNANAEKIIRQALAQAGVPARYRIVPGDSVASVAKLPSASAGSVDSEARNHPLVMKSAKIFDAEICSVIDLRPK